MRVDYGEPVRPTPFMVAWSAFVKDAESSFNYNTLTPGPFLANRLHLAFCAGWNAARKDAEQQGAANPTTTVDAVREGTK